MTQGRGIPERPDGKELEAGPTSQPLVGVRTPVSGSDDEPCAKLSEKEKRRTAQKKNEPHKIWRKFLKQTICGPVPPSGLATRSEESQ